MRIPDRPPRGGSERRDEVILVDRLDNELGSMEKLEAHRKSALHRAFSVFLFNSRNELLLQRRSEQKYHSPGLWTNTCCSHPRPGEEVLSGAARRLREEMGVSCPLRFAFTFLYRAEFQNGLSEHELDHVFLGTFDGEPRVDPNEVADWKFEALPAIADQVRESPDRFTEWFKIVLPRLGTHLRRP